MEGKKGPRWMQTATAEHDYEKRETGKGKGKYNRYRDQRWNGKQSHNQITPLKGQVKRLQRLIRQIEKEKGEGERGNGE